MQNTNLLEVKNLKTHFFTEKGIIPAVDDVSFKVGIGETLGIVGESGCGKSMTSLSIMRLVPKPFGKIVGGQILYKGQDILGLSEDKMRKMRGNNISMIFQEPMTSLNPVFTIGEQIQETIILHQKVNRITAKNIALKMLNLVNIPIPEKRICEYPHQLSGGMRQRVMIAMALCCNPELLICDEPTTALDVTIQAQILGLINSIKKNINTSIIMITHDLGVISETADNVLVMYAGNVVEYGNVDEIINHPLHPYTRGLINSIPRIREEKDELYTIKGMVPSLYNVPSGCLFSPRCEYATDICFDKKPHLVNYEGREIRCWKYINL